MTPPQYITLLNLNNNISNVCFLCVLSTELGSQIDRGSHRDRFNSIPKNLQSTIFVILSKRAFTRIQACEQLRKFCEHEQASMRLKRRNFSHTFFFHIFRDFEWSLRAFAGMGALRFCIARTSMQ